jgi:hypothetical protein
LRDRCRRVSSPKRDDAKSVVTTLQAFVLMRRLIRKASLL